ncbi:MAG: BON domain-containing protein [Acidobacteriaceae bacterium]|nr:BON domain-containing protein [Acidobacteriaceae bacterium]MBV9778882.1 BON domain-containing protein [Acidobacteriaceae bacterium]
MRTKFRSPMFTAVVSAAMLLSSSSAWGKQDKNHNDAFVRGTADESRIAHQVRHELVMLPYYGIFDDLAFRVDGTAITLLGAVVNPVLKSDAENVVKRVEGVTNVVNNIEVLPVSPMDDQIRRAEFRAIYGDPSIGTKYGYQALPSIHIIVKNGHVLLEGVVDSQFDKTLINTRANAVANVFSVTNNLQVTSEKQK